MRRASAKGGLDVPLSIFVLKETLGGLHHAHESADLDGTKLRIVHRDVSPHNVMITYDGAVKVLDFGIAKAADSVEETQTGVVKGKATYMAPEQAMREPIDRRADVFAVGVMLWQALTGARLWGELSDFEIFLRLKTGAIPTPSSAGARGDVPSALEAICMRALAPKRDDRYATAGEMQAAIDDYLESSGHRVGTRQLAQRMNELFADDRAAVRADIEREARRPGALATGAEIPRLGAAPDREGSRMNVRAARGSLGRSTRAEAASGRRRTVRLALAVFVVAAAAVGVASFRAVRAKSSRATIGATIASTASTPAGASPPCTTNADCQGGVRKICRKEDGKCVAVESEDCQLLGEAGDLDDDRAILFGAMYPVTGPQAAFGGITAKNAIDLARRDFVQIAHGIPGSSGESKPRPMAVVLCDDAVDPRRGAHHLVDELHVPAVMGFKSSQEVIDLATSVFIPRRVLTIASLNMSALITAIPQPRGEPRLVWRTVLSSAEVVLPVSLMVSQLVEKPLNAAGVVGPGVPMRVALVRHGTTAGLSFADALFAHVRYNGRSIVENGTNFKELVLPNSEPIVDAGAGIAAALAEFKPHLVLCVGQGELTDLVMKPLERTQHPYYVFTNGLDGKEFFELVGKDASLRKRVLAIAPPATTLANAKFTLRYNETFPDKVTLNLSPTGPYDAMYVLAYAAYIAGDAPLDGRGLARAIARLVPPGKPIEVGPARIFEGFEALGRGENIDLRGSGNRLDFDLTTGESPGDYTVQCVARVDGTKSFDSIESGVTYDADTKTLKGTLHCR